MRPHHRPVIDRNRDLLHHDAKLNNRMPIADPRCRTPAFHSGTAATTTTYSGTGRTEEPVQRSPLRYVTSDQRHVRARGLAVPEGSQGQSTAAGMWRWWLRTHGV